MKAEARKSKPVPNLLRIRDPETSSVRVSGSSIDLGILDIEDINEIGEANKIRDLIREKCEKFERMRHLKSAYSDTCIDFLVHVSFVQQFEYSVNPDTSASVAFIGVKEDEIQSTMKLIKEIENIETQLLGENEVSDRIKLTEDYHRRRGELFGYPECDVNFYIKNFSKNNTERTEKKSVKKFLESDIWFKILKDPLSGSKNFEKFIADPPEEFYSLPTNSFYPHSTKCSNSINLSKTALKHIRTEEGERLYKFDVFFNHMEVITRQLNNINEDQTVRKFFNKLCSTEKGQKSFKYLNKQLKNSHYLSNYNKLREKLY